MIDIAIPIIACGVSPKKPLKKAQKLTIGLTLLVGNVLIAYLSFLFAFSTIEDEQQHNPILAAVITFALLIAIEGYIVYRLSRKDTDLLKVEISTSPADYKKLILDAERGAREIRMLPKRIHVMFKSREFIDYLAEKRFGAGSQYKQPYIDEHIARSSTLMQALGNGLVMYEIHNKANLIEYVQRRGHPGVDDIEIRYIREMILEWKRVLNQYPDNYFVRLTDELIPLKYELIDSSKLVMHESAGKNSRDRLNAIFIESQSVTEQIGKDFSKIWDGVPPDQCTTEYVSKWIDDNLLARLV